VVEIFAWENNIEGNIPFTATANYYFVDGTVESINFSGENYASIVTDFSNTADFLS